MDSRLRVAVSLPLKELWDENGTVNAVRLRYVSQADIADMLRLGPVQFVVADTGETLSWVKPSECYEYWKNEVKPHLASPESSIELDAFPDSYCYFGSEWRRQNSIPIVLLERTH